MGILGIIIMVLFCAGLIMTMVGAEEDYAPVIIGGVTSMCIASFLGICTLCGTVTVLLWILILTVIHVILFAICYKIQTLADFADKKSMITYAAIPLANLIVIGVATWAYIDYRYEVRQKIKSCKTKTSNKIKSMSKKMLDGTLNIIDKCPPKAKK